MNKLMPLGPVMIDVAGTTLTQQDRQRLLHPLVGGIILFARNFESAQQLRQLTDDIHALRSPQLIIAVDHEGGRVQRFQQGFTRIPAMRKLGLVWDHNRPKAAQLAKSLGFVLASELLAHGVDLSFTPVLDVDYGNSSVIGDRAFHHQAEAIAELAAALMQGLREAGMGAVGKHFPGHGHVRADSHHEVPVDDRSYSDIKSDDLVPFAGLIGEGLSAIMPAHVIYPKVDAAPAGFSEKWLKEILRGELGFDGVIFSDDLSMEGASVAGGVLSRARAALLAGCDMVLVCNNPQSADELLATLDYMMPPASQARLERMHGRHNADGMAGLQTTSQYVEALRAMAALGTDAA